MVDGLRLARLLAPMARDGCAVGLRRSMRNVFGLDWHVFGGWVSTIRIFRFEDEVHASRLQDAGVRVEFRLVQSAQHGFDMIAPQAPGTKREWQAHVAFLSST